MEHNHHMHEGGNHNEQSFTPLIIVFLAILFITGVRQLFLPEFNLMTLMETFMGPFFVIFGFFKIVNWKEFTQMYAGYDIIAKRSKTYAYLYPLIEIGLGLSYFVSLFPVFINAFTFVLMAIGSIGVIQALRTRKGIECACLGGVFKFPMTKVTLIEDMLMGVMAGAMLIMLVL